MVETITMTKQVRGFFWPVDSYSACQEIFVFMETLLAKCCLGQYNNRREYFISCNSLRLQRSMSTSPNAHEHRG